MNILVTGATGFIGRHLVPLLLARGHALTVLARDVQRASTAPWFGRVHFVECDIHAPIDKPFKRFSKPDAMVHLAWPGLPNYKSLAHLEHTLPAECRFLNSLVEAGLPHLLVTGTCFEYGMQNGCLTETMPTQPTNPYGKAKDDLRRYLQDLQRSNDFALQWTRLFYTYGEGQNPGSLLAQLDRAINKGDTIFNMSGGEQIRDYLPVEEVAYRLALLVENPTCAGIVNICSGHPISVLDLILQHIRRRGASIGLNRGYYPYPDYEPMEFWGNPEKFEKAIFARAISARHETVPDDTNIQLKRETNG